MSILSFATKKARAADTKKEAKQDVSEKAAVVVESVPALELIPHISEASVADQSLGVYTFRVKPKASKLAISAAVNQRFGVAPVWVRTANVRGKTRRRGRTVGSSPNWKKAWVKLPAGKTIDLTN